MNTRILQQITSLAITPSVTRGRAKVQKTLTLSLSRNMDFETDDQCGWLQSRWPREVSR